jgi:hypothetical protein
MFIIKVTNIKSGEYVFSQTNNIKQRLDRLRYNVLSVNGKGTAVHDRFKPFIGCDPFDENDVSFEVYKQIDYKEKA